MKLQALRGFNPWVLIFVGMSLFHLWPECTESVSTVGHGTTPKVFLRHEIVNKSIKKNEEVFELSNI